MAVVHIDTAFPRYATGVDAERVTLMYMVVQHGGHQVIGRADGVHIAGEMQVDVFHGHDLGISAARRAAFDTENGAERRFAKSHRNIPAYAFKSVGKSYRRGRFSLAGGGRSHGGHQNEFALFARSVGKQGKVDFCLVFSVLLNIFFVNARRRGYFCYRLHLTSLRYFYIRKVCHTVPLSFFSRKNYAPDRNSQTHGEYSQSKRSLYLLLYQRFSLTSRGKAFSDQFCFVSQ